MSAHFWIVHLGGGGGGGLKRLPPAGRPITSHPAAEAQQALLQAQTDGRVWLDPLRERAEALTLRTAELVIKAHRRVEEAGGVTRAVGLEQVAARFDITPTTVQDWDRQGLIKKHLSDNYNRGLWELPAGYDIAKGKPGKHTQLARLVLTATPLTEQSAL